jgi:hypothetical protein
MATITAGVLDMDCNSSSPDLSRRALLSGTVASLVALMLNAGPVDAAAEARAEADPRYSFVDRLSDLVIPDTSTPGASKARVGVFVLLAVDHQMGSLAPASLERVRTALDAAAAAAGTAGTAGADFMTAPPARANGLLSALDAAAFAKPDAAADSVDLAWRHLKAAIVAGYYTSEIGASQELVYEPVPGRFANIRLTADFRSRSNDGFGGTL